MRTLLNENVIVQCGRIIITSSAVKMFSTDVLEEEFSSLLSARWEVMINNALTLVQKLGHIGGLIKRRDCGLDLLAGILNGQKASDQQQHLFALLSLADPANTAHITPDYKLTLVEVFTNFARTMIENQGRISFSTTPFVVITLELDTMILK